MANKPFVDPLESDDIPPLAPVEAPVAKEPHPLAFERGLPASLDAERFTLGSILLDGTKFEDVAAVLRPEHFSLQKHTRIFSRMVDLHERGHSIDRVTVAEELMKQGQLESVDGLTYLSSLDHGIPEIANLGSYIRLVLEKYNLRKIIFESQKAIDQALLGLEDPAEIANRFTDRLQEVAQAGVLGESDGKSPTQVIEDAGGIINFLDPTQRQSGIMSGFTRLDEVTNGIHRGELTLIGARPSVGKTSFALNVAYNVALKSKIPVHFYSLEMSPVSLLTRMVCTAARVDQHKFRCGFLNTEERRRLQVYTSQIIDLPLTIFDLPGAGVKEVTSRTKAWMKKNELGLIIIDYIGLMKVDSKAENMTVALGQISRGLKLLTRECNIPIWALSQLSRPDKTARFSPPDLVDLRSSGSLEQDADNVMFLWREEMVRPDREDIKGQADLILRKQRQGPITKVPLRFISAFTSFENRSEDIGDSDPENRSIGQ